MGDAGWSAVMEIPGLAKHLQRSLASIAQYFLHNQRPFFVLLGPQGSIEQNLTLLTKTCPRDPSRWCYSYKHAVLFLLHPAISLAHIAGKRAMQPSS